LREPEKLRGPRRRDAPEPQGVGDRKRLPYGKRQPSHDLIGKLGGAGHGEYDDQQSRHDPARLVEKLP
jgi:hypothetical protein